MCVTRRVCGAQAHQWLRAVGNGLDAKYVAMIMEKIRTKNRSSSEDTKKRKYPNLNGSTVFGTTTSASREKRMTTKPVAAETVSAGRTLLSLNILDVLTGGSAVATDDSLSAASCFRDALKRRTHYESLRAEIDHEAELEQKRLRLEAVNTVAATVSEEKKPGDTGPATVEGKPVVTVPVSTTCPSDIDALLGLSEEFTTTAETSAVESKQTGEEDVANKEQPSTAAAPAPAPAKRKFVIVRERSDPKEQLRAQNPVPTPASIMRNAPVEGMSNGMYMNPMGYNTMGYQGVRAQIPHRPQMSGLSTLPVQSPIQLYGYPHGTPNPSSMTPEAYEALMSRRTAYPHK